MNSDELIQAMKSMTAEERLAFLKAQRPDVFEVAPRTVSFGRAPRDGWTDQDRVEKENER